MLSTIPILLISAREFEPDFMHQSHGLERVVVLFARQPVGGQPPQFFIDQRQQFLGGLGVALVGAVQYAGHFAQRKRPIPWRILMKAKTKPGRARSDAYGESGNGSKQNWQK
jgi:hypothetical protein